MCGRAWFVNDFVGMRDLDAVCVQRRVRLFDLCRLHRKARIDLTTF